MTREDRDFFDVQKGIEYEKRGEIDKAISIYEKLVRRKFEGSHAYDRLCVIYRKQKAYELEERVLLKAIAVFSKIVDEGFRSDGPPKLARYKERLEKLHKKMDESK